MQTGAHPDDETTKMLAKLTLSEGMHVVYCNAVRGQGGQNALGVERGDDLGILRTQELVFAMKTLGADLYWLAETEDDPIRDFGFSKSPEQTFDIWGHEHTLRQMVKAIRIFKPDLLCPTFLDVAGQHGHHRAVTRVTIEAFDFSGDPDVFSDLKLDPWTVSKLYLPGWGGGGSSYDDEEPPPEATTFLDVGSFDYRMGGTYAQIGEWSRGYHATQGMGKLRDESPEILPLHLLKTSGVFKNIEEEKVSSGLPATWQDLEKIFDDGKIIMRIRQADLTSLKAIKAFPDNRNVADSLSEFSEAVDSLKDMLPELHRHRAERKIRQAGQAMAACCVLKPRLRFFPREPVTGKEFDVDLSVHKWVGLDESNILLEIHMPPGINVQLDAQPSKEGSRLSWKGKGIFKKKWGPVSPFKNFHSEILKEEPPRADVIYSVNGRDYQISVVPENPFKTFPEISCSLQPSNVVIPLHLKDSVKSSGIDMNLSVKVHTPSKHEVEIKIPKGFKKEENKITLNPGMNSGVILKTHIEPLSGIKPGLYPIYVNLDKESAWDFKEFEYPHIGRSVRQFKCISNLLVLEVEVPKNHQVGWINGGFEQSWYWASEMGFSVSLISDDELVKGQFNSYDTIVIGAQAASKRPIHSALKSLKEWIHQGGRLVTQYHRPIDRWNPDSTPPGRIVIGSPSIRWRITNPNALIEVLNPEHISMKVPNKIDTNDWKGWVKERGLYFASEWDERYEALVQVADPGEPALLGGLLFGRFGQGSHVHCALNLFYQMDHLVTGAFRIFANLQSNINIDECKYH